MSQELVMSGIDGKLDMYTHMPIKKWPDILGYLKTFVEKKTTYVDAHGVYSREAFDPNDFQFIYPLKESIVYSAETYGSVNVDGNNISEESIDYLIDYKNFVESKGAKLYFIGAPILDQALTSDVRELTKLKNLEEQLIGIK